MQLKSAQVYDPRHAAVPQLPLQDGPSPGASGDVAPAAGDEGGAPAPGQREELEAQIAIVRGQVAEVESARAAYLEAFEAAGAEDQQAFKAVRATCNQKVIVGPDFEKLSGVVRELATSWNATWELEERHEHPQHRLELLQYELRARFPASASLPLDTSGPPADIAVEAEGAPVVIHARDPSRIERASEEIKEALAGADPAAARKPKKKRDPEARFKKFDASLAQNGPGSVTTHRKFVDFLKELLDKKDCTAANLHWESTSDVPGLKKQDFRVQAAFESFLKLTPYERAAHNVVASLRLSAAEKKIEKQLQQILAAPVVIHAAQGNSAERDPSRAFKTMMKEAAKPARISFPKFIAEQMKWGKCGVEALDLQTISMHPDYANLHADVQKLVNAFLALPDTSRRIPDILDRIGHATEEIEKELAKLTEAPVAARKHGKKQDSVTRLKDFEACLAQNGPTGLTRDKFAKFLASLMYQNAWVAANLHWESASGVPGLKKEDFRVQAAFESFLKLSPDERAAHCVGVEVRQAGDEIAEAKKRPIVLGPQASDDKKRSWDGPAEIRAIKSLLKQVVSESDGDQLNILSEKLKSLDPRLVLRKKSDANDPESKMPSATRFTSEAEFESLDKLASNVRDFLPNSKSSAT